MSLPDLSNEDFLRELARRLEARTIPKIIQIAMLRHTDTAIIFLCYLKPTKTSEIADFSGFSAGGIAGTAKELMAEGILGQDPRFRWYLRREALETFESIPDQRKKWLPC